MRARLATLGAGGGFAAGRNAPGGSLGMDMLGACMGSPNPIAAMRANSPFLRHNSPFPRDTQEIIDNEILKVGRSNLVIASDLLDAGLTKALPNWLSLTTFTAQRVGEAGRAQVGMTPNTRGERQVQDLGEFSTPVFAIWDDWEFDARTLATAARVGYPIDTSMAEQATRNVNEKIEDVTLNGLVDANGDNVLVYGLPVYGLLNAPNANTGTFAGNEAWDAAGKTGAEIFTDIQSMMQDAKAANYPGPFTLYIPTDYGFKLMEDYNTNYPRTIMSRLLEIPNLQAIKVVDAMPDDTVILLQKTSNVFDFLVGMMPTNFSWPTNPNMPFSGVSSMVAAVIIPRPKFDYNDQSGIVIYTAT